MRWPLLTLLLGIGMLTAGVVLHAAHPTQVARLPVPAAPGPARVEFGIADSGVHEIELEVLLDALDESAYEAVRIQNAPSPIDVAWEIRDASGARVGGGDSREFAYFPVWAGTGDRLRDTLLRRADHRGIGSGTIARGVGSFRAQAGDRLVLHAQVGSVPAGVMAAQPHLVVRVQRAVARARQTGPDRWIGAGVVALLVGLLWTGVRVLCR